MCVEVLLISPANRSLTDDMFCDRCMIAFDSPNDHREHILEYHTNSLRHFVCQYIANNKIPCWAYGH